MNKPNRRQRQDTINFPFSPEQATLEQLDLYWLDPETSTMVLELVRFEYRRRRLPTPSDRLLVERLSTARKLPKHDDKAKYRELRRLAAAPNPTTVVQFVTAGLLLAAAVLAFWVAP